MAEEARADTPGIRVLPPFVYLGGLIAGYVLWWFWPVAIVPGGWSVATRIVGGIALVLGFWVMLWAVAIFRRAGEEPNPMAPTKALTFDGPYRFTRNPMYLGMALIQAGLALLGNALWPLLALIPVIAFIRTQVIEKEERYLQAKFGGQYSAFKTRVRRWL